MSQSEERAMAWAIRVASLLFLAAFVLYLTSCIPYRARLKHDFVPPMGKAVKRGCSITQEGAYWKTQVWVEYQDAPRWEQAISMPPTLKQASLDCTAWMSGTQKGGRHVYAPRSHLRGVRRPDS